MPLDLEAIRKRCEAATAPPWWVEPIPLPSYDDPGWRGVLYGPGLRTAGTPVIAAERDAVLRVREGAGCRTPADIKADLQFAAHARTDLPDAIAELAAARARIAGLEAEVGRGHAAAEAVLQYDKAIEPCLSAGPWRTMLAYQAMLDSARAALKGKPASDQEVCLGTYRFAVCPRCGGKVPL